MDLYDKINVVISDPFTISNSEADCRHSFHRIGKTPFRRKEEFCGESNGCDGRRSLFDSLED